MGRAREITRFHFEENHRSEKGEKILSGLRVDTADNLYRRLCIRACFKAVCSEIVSTAGSFS